MRPSDPGFHAFSAALDRYLTPPDALVDDAAPCACCRIESTDLDAHGLCPGCAEPDPHMTEEAFLDVIRATARDTFRLWGREVIPSAAWSAQIAALTYPILHSAPVTNDFVTFEVSR